MFMQIFTTPSSVRFETEPPQFQMELINLQCDTILKDRYYHYNSDLISFYQGVKQQHFPKILALALETCSMLGTTCFCEQMFSLMN
ncbi:unnamed protein product [Acanthoscelides obtectus]|uniref:HAT C-terminal dimerisation domain-containing protein n=1 Tax=Acanthoscelides obtectus TaxID=200917 RepID=A0A9P0M1A6_ACAOB|nr:unnamed protein product [Acanthoscelides obtectus]CAK1670833.1 General transcription factor II-I repeat domain-containing protein 2 [Acanthoscelides obtectus]